MKNYLCYLFLFLGTQNFYAQNMKNYCNSRFDFCVSVPSNFKNLGESENGDGQSFQSHDGNAKIITFGNLEIEGINDLESLYKQYLKSKKITYKFRKGNYFILSGIEKNGNIFYLKTIKKRINYFGEKADVVQNLMISCPKSQNSKYSSYCKVISKSL